MLAPELAALFSRDITRLIQELQAFPDTATLWKTLPGVTNSAGNLALHLEGNLREYIGRQLGAIDYTRDRPAEFGRKDVAQAELIARLESVRDLVPPIIAALPASAMDAAYPEQMFGAPISTRQFLIHLLGHLSYHLGQIDYLRRVLTGDSAIKLASL